MGLNSFQLKCIAIVTMVIDHIGAILYPYEIMFRVIGRLSFPIFCFLIVEGFFHTRDVRRYAARLLLFALISEIPYDLAFSGVPWDTGRQNVFFTLALGVLLMCAMSRCHGHAARAACLLLAAFAAELLRTDYSFRGICLIAIFWLLREREFLKLAAGALWNLSYGISSVQCYGALSVVPISLYNGERGPGVKYFFYVFYPAHLLILYALHIYVFC